MLRIAALMAIASALSAPALVLQVEVQEGSERPRRSHTVPSASNEVLAGWRTVANVLGSSLVSMRAGVDLR